MRWRLLSDRRADWTETPRARAHGRSSRDVNQLPNRMTNPTYPSPRTSETKRIAMIVATVIIAISQDLAPEPGTPPAGSGAEESSVTEATRAP